MTELDATRLVNAISNDPNCSRDVRRCMQALHRKGDSNLAVLNKLSVIEYNPILALNAIVGNDALLWAQLRRESKQQQPKQPGLLDAKMKELQVVQKKITEDAKKIPSLVFSAPSDATPEQKSFVTEALEGTDDRILTILESIEKDAVLPKVETHLRILGTDPATQIITKPLQMNLADKVIDSLPEGKVKDTAVAAENWYDRATTPLTSQEILTAPINNLVSIYNGLVTFPEQMETGKIGPFINSIWALGNLYSAADDAMGSARVSQIANEPLKVSWRNPGSTEILGTEKIGGGSSWVGPWMENGGVNPLITESYGFDSPEKSSEKKLVDPIINGLYDIQGFGECKVENVLKEGEVQFKTKSGELKSMSVDAFKRRATPLEVATQY